MNYREVLEHSLLDELEKIAAAEKAVPGLWSRISKAWSKKGLEGVGKVRAARAPLSVWGKRALYGAAPGAAVGYAASDPGEGVSGALKGGVAGAALGLGGGALAQRHALGQIKGWKSGMTAAREAKVMAAPAAKKQYQAATTQAFPGIFGGGAG